MPLSEQVLAEWRDLANLLARQPRAERRSYESGLHKLLHDLNQNLGIILCAEELLRRSLVPTSDTAELLDSIQQATKETIELTRQFSQQLELPSQDQEQS